MKALLYSGLLLALLISFNSTLQAQNQINLPVNFDSTNVNYTLIDFNGASSSFSVNQLDSTDIIAKTIKTQDSGTSAGTTIGTNLGFKDAIPFTVSSKKMSLFVYSPAAGINVRLKVEDHNDNTLTAETQTTTTVGNKWERLVFDFSTVAPGTNPFNLSTRFDKASIFFGFGSIGAGEVFYWDDLQFGAGPEPANTSLSDLAVDGMTITGFSAATLTYSYEVADSNASVPVVTATTADPEATYEITPATEVPGTTTIVVSGTDSLSYKTYSVNFEIKPIVYPDVVLPLDMEAGPYNFLDFDGGYATVLANPFPSEANNSATVTRIIKAEGAEWAGSKIVLADKLDFSIMESISMKVYSPRADMPVLFKLESTATGATQVLENTTVANEWETMTWDFTDAQAGIFDILVFMFDFGTVGDSTANFTFFFDDVTQYENAARLSKVELPISFEEDTVDFTMIDFDGTETTLITDPTNANNTVAMTVKKSNAGEYSGTTMSTELGMKTAIPFTTDAKKLTMNVYSPAAGTPIRLKAEDHNDARLTAETDALTTKANEWEEIVFDFGNVATGTNPFNLNTNFDKLTVFFNVTKKGTGEVYYWDNVKMEGDVIISNEELITADLPLESKIIGSYPNPFNPSTTIEYYLQDNGAVNISVYNMQGQKIATLLNGRQTSGTYNLRWEAGNVASGVYFIRLLSSTNNSVQKVLLIK